MVRGYTMLFLDIKYKILQDFKVNNIIFIINESICIKKSLTLKSRKENLMIGFISLFLEMILKQRLYKNINMGKNMTLKLRFGIPAYQIK